MSNEIMVYQQGTQAIVIDNNEVGFFKGEHVQYVKTRVGENGFQWHLFENQHRYVFELTDEQVLMKGEAVTWELTYISDGEKESKVFTLPASIIDDAVRKLRLIEPRANIIKVEMVG